MRARGAMFVVLLAAGCQTTTDSLGSNQIGPPPTAVLHPVTRPTSYPRPLQEVLGLLDTTVAARVSNLYGQLFHSDLAPAVYNISLSEPTQAYMWDVLHQQIRSEGQGLGMMIALQMNDQDVFDHLWRYARSRMQVLTGPTSGYFNSFCDAPDQTSSSACLDPFGFEQFVTALIFAHDRWGSTDAMNYQQDALALFHTMKHKADDAGAGTATNVFDATAHLPYAFPDTSYAGLTRPSIVMPGYYAVWAQADADDTFSADATSGRALIQAAAHPTSGLVPLRSTFTGSPLPAWAYFGPEAYRTQINVAVDQIWTGGTPENVKFLNRLLAFFSGVGISSYGTSYTLDGTQCTNPLHETSLVASNAIAAGVCTTCTNADRMQYLSAFWTMSAPIGQSRYYTGLLQLWGLLILSGQFQIY